MAVIITQTLRMIFKMENIKPFLVNKQVRFTQGSITDFDLLQSIFPAKRRTAAQPPFSLRSNQINRGAILSCIYRNLWSAHGMPALF